MIVHFVDENWQRRDFPIGLAHFELNESKSAVNIGHKICEMLDKFEIGTKRIIGILYDGAPVMPASARAIEVIIF